MDQATFFVILHLLLESLHCPLDDDKRDDLQLFLDELQDEMSIVNVEGGEVVRRFQDQSSFVMGSNPVLTNKGTEVLAMDLFTKILKALK